MRTPADRDDVTARIGAALAVLAVLPVAVAAVLVVLHLSVGVDPAAATTAMWAAVGVSAAWAVTGLVRSR